MDAALAWRRRAFLLVGVPCIVLVLSAEALARVFDEESSPNALTFGAWLFVVLDLVVLLRWLFGESQIRRMHRRVLARTGARSLAAVGKPLSFFGASIVATPVLVGLVMLLISGDPWRLYIFVPISLLGGIFVWRRIEDALRLWPQVSGVTEPESG